MKKRKNPDSQQREVYAEYQESIETGMAEALWTYAYMQFAEENRDAAKGLLGIAKAGEDWFNLATAHGLPAAADRAGKDLYKLYETTNGNLVELYGFAQEADMGEAFSYTPTSGLDQWKTSDASEFGQSLAMMAVGSGVSWFDDHKEFAYEKVDFECYFDGGELTWSGAASSDVREVTNRIGRIVVINAFEGYYRHRYLLRFGGFTEATATYLLIGANGLDGAVDELIDWVRDEHLDGLATDTVSAAYVEHKQEGMSDEDAQAAAEVDMTQGGNYSDYINSEDWSIVAEDPTDAQIKQIAYAKNPDADPFAIPGVTNPAGRFTAKGERMYQEVMRSYAGDARAKEIAARTVQKMSKQVPGLVKNPACTPNPTATELRDPHWLAKNIREALDNEFATKVESIKMKPGREKTLDQFKQDLANNLAMGFMLDED